MSCDKCGAKLLDPDQKFCQKCGAITKMTSTASQSGSQITIMSTQSNSQGPKQVAQDQKISPIPRKIGLHSKRSLAFGIISLGSSTIDIFLYIFPFYLTPANLSRLTNLMYFITVIAIFALIVIGLVFGILARSNGNKAEMFESHNGLQKAGKIIGLVGIIIISLIIGTIVLSNVILSADFMFRNYISV